MTNLKHTLINKFAAFALFPALALGLFTSPALALAQGVDTVVDVENTNSVDIVNAFDISASTGNNTANGGDGAEGGDSGDSGENAGDGGEGGEGGDGGNASSEGESAYAESGYGALGGNGGTGGDTGQTGNGGNGGNGGAGGQISTGDASASVSIDTNVNTNTTEISFEDVCGCDLSNEYFESAETFYERNMAEWAANNNSWYSNESDDCSVSEDGGMNMDEMSATDELMDETYWEIYTKEIVPVNTEVAVANENTGSVLNTGSIDAETGGNTAVAGDGAEGGDSGDSGDDAGNGGLGGDGGDGGDADAYSWDGDDPAFAFDGGAGGTGGNGGTTGMSGHAGHGGNGAEGGLIVTGLADAHAAVIEIANRNVTRIVR